jgi:hypothetical protein
MVSMLTLSVVDHYTTNDLPLKVSMLTITPPMIYHTQVEHANHYITNDLPHSR